MVETRLHEVAASDVGSTIRSEDVRQLAADGFARYWGVVTENDSVCGALELRGDGPREWALAIKCVRVGEFANRGLVMTLESSGVDLGSRYTYFVPEGYEQSMREHAEGAHVEGNVAMFTPETAPYQKGFPTHELVHEDGGTSIHVSFPFRDPRHSIAEN